MIATDFFDPGLIESREYRWNKAFTEFKADRWERTFSEDQPMADANTDLKATVVLELIIQAADIAVRQL